MTHFCIYLTFGAIFAEAWIRVATVGNTVNGLSARGIRHFNPNRLPEPVFAPTSVHEDDTNSTVKNQYQTADLQITSAPKNNKVEELQVLPTTEITKDTANGRGSFMDLSPVSSASGSAKNKRRWGGQSLWQILPLKRVKGKQEGSQYCTNEETD